MKTFRGLEKLWLLSNHIFQNNILRHEISQGYFGATNEYIPCWIFSVCHPVPVFTFLHLALCPVG